MENNDTFVICHFRDLYPDVDIDTIRNILYISECILLKHNHHSFKYDDVDYIVKHWEQNKYNYKLKFVDDILCHAILLEQKFKRTIPWYERIFFNIFGWDDIMHIDYILEHWEDF